MKTFGEVIRLHRKRARMTLQDLVDRISGHKGYISGIENGKVNPPSATVTKRLAKALKLPSDRLILLGHCEKAPVEIREWLLAKMAPLMQELEV